MQRPHPAAGEDTSVTAECAKLTVAPGASPVTGECIACMWHARHAQDSARTSRPAPRPQLARRTGRYPEGHAWQWGRIHVSKKHVARHAART
jgi:hypothetical protein